VPADLIYLHDDQLLSEPPDTSSGKRFFMSVLAQGSGRGVIFPGSGHTAA